MYCLDEFRAQKYQIKEETKSVLDLYLFVSEGLSNLHHAKQNCG
jgi:hypothetical protein